jgi:hypothetical protein
MDIPFCKTIWPIEKPAEAGIKMAGMGCGEYVMMMGTW